MTILPQNDVLPLFESKQCKRCCLVLDISLFGKNHRYKSNIDSFCKACQKIKQNEVIARYIENPQIVSEKACNRCKEVRVIDSFYKDKTRADGYSHECKDCCNTRKNAYNQTPIGKAKQSEKTKKLRASNPGFAERRRDSSRNWCSLNDRFRTHGVSHDQFLLMKSDQNNLCAICGIDFDLLPPKRVHVDHCHKTGKVRRILCYRCNIFLGFAQENIKTLENAIKYIQHHQL